MHNTIQPLETAESLPLTGLTHSNPAFANSGDHFNPPEIPCVIAKFTAFSDCG
jgi:hypothetical protein